MNVYIDDTTGKYYIWDGNRYWEYGDEVTLAPKIGSRGNADLDDAEEAARQAQIDKEEAENDELKKLNRSRDDNKRIKDISREIGSDDFSQGIEHDRVKANQNELRRNKKAAAANAGKYRGIAGGIEIFKKDLSKLLGEQVKEVEMSTWSKPNRRYTTSPFIMPGTRMEDNPEIPTLRIYFDHSGSWDESKIAEGKAVIEAIVHDYVKKKKLAIEVLYFGNQVSLNPDDTGGGTEGTPIMEDIAKYKPKNVVIMTDSDIGDIRSNTLVPGGVFLLFKGGVSLNLQDHIQGKKITRSYEI